MSAMDADPDEEYATMDRSQALQLFPQVRFSRTHRPADSLPMTGVSVQPPCPLEANAGKESMMELCRALDRLFWKRYTTPTREERNEHE